MKAIVIDDELRARRILKTLLKENCPQINVVGEAENVPDAVQLIHKTNPDIVFSDIEMPEYSGFELLKFISNIDFALVFVTAYQEYAIRAFEVSAVDYLLKPIETELLKKAVEKVEKRLEITGNLQNNQKMETLRENLKGEYLTRFALPMADGLMFVEADDIMYLIAEGSYTEIVFSDKKRVLITKKIKYFEENLVNPCFFRSHRSYIVNLNKISQYIRTGNYIVMDDGFKASLARDRKDDFLKIYQG
uniref:LytR/AlgR family response regulator transcription factor n=1 Tax=Bernardetia sp. TaxID=1937974 RepID=UPI0025BD264B